MPHASNGYRKPVSDSDSFGGNETWALDHGASTEVSIKGEEFARAVYNMALEEQQGPVLSRSTISSRSGPRHESPVKPFRTIFYEEPKHHPPIGNTHMCYEMDAQIKEREKYWKKAGTSVYKSSEMRIGKTPKELAIGHEKPAEFPKVFEKPDKVFGRTRELNPFRNAKKYTKPHYPLHEVVDPRGDPKGRVLTPWSYNPYNDPWGEKSKPVCGVVPQSAIFKSKTPRAISPSAIQTRQFENDPNLLMTLQTGSGLDTKSNTNSTELLGRSDSQLQQQQQQQLLQRRASSPISGDDGYSSGSSYGSSSSSESPGNQPAHLRPRKKHQRTHIHHKHGHRHFRHLFPSTDAMKDITERRRSFIRSSSTLEQVEVPDPDHPVFQTIVKVRSIAAGDLRKEQEASAEEKRIQEEEEAKAKILSDHDGSMAGSVLSQMRYDASTNRTSRSADLRTLESASASFRANSKANGPLEPGPSVSSGHTSLPSQISQSNFAPHHHSHGGLKPEEFETDTKREEKLYADFIESTATRDSVSKRGLLIGQTSVVFSESDRDEKGRKPLTASGSEHLVARSKSPGKTMALFRAGSSIPAHHNQRGGEVERQSSFTLHSTSSSKPGTADSVAIAGSGRRGRGTSSGGLDNCSPGKETRAWSPGASTIRARSRSPNKPNDAINKVGGGRFNTGEPPSLWGGNLSDLADLTYRRIVLPDDTAYIVPFSASAAIGKSPSHSSIDSRGPQSPATAAAALLLMNSAATAPAKVMRSTSPPVAKAPDGTLPNGVGHAYSWAQTAFFADNDESMALDASRPPVTHSIQHRGGTPSSTMSFRNGKNGMNSSGIMLPAAESTMSADSSQQVGRYHKHNNTTNTAANSVDVGSKKPMMMMATLPNGLKVQTKSTKEYSPIFKMDPTNPSTPKFTPTHSRTASPQMPNSRLTAPIFNDEDSSMATSLANSREGSARGGRTIEDHYIQHREHHMHTASTDLAHGGGSMHSAAQDSMSTNQVPYSQQVIRRWVTPMYYSAKKSGALKDAKDADLALAAQRQQQYQEWMTQHGPGMSTYSSPSSRQGSRQGGARPHTSSGVLDSYIHAQATAKFGNKSKPSTSSKAQRASSPSGLAAPAISVPMVGFVDGDLSTVAPPELEHTADFVRLHSLRSLGVLEATGGGGGGDLM